MFKQIKESKWDKYRISTTIKGEDSILEYTLLDDADFKDLDGQTKKIEIGTLDFIKDVEHFLLRENL